MSAISVKYLGDQQAAEISTSSPTTAWLEVRRAFEERTGELVNVSPNIFTVPWWVFLSCRKAFKYLIEKHGLSLNLQQQVMELLKKALENEKTYELSVHTVSSEEDDIEQKLINAGFTRKLTPEQKRNITKLLTLTSSADFSVPGSGKTTEALAFFFLKKNKDSRLLVVAPKNAFAAWEEQIALCAPDSDLKIVRLRGGAENIRTILETKPKCMVVTYHQLINIKNEIASFMSAFPTIMILDESHRIKRGYEGEIGSSVLSLSHIPVAKMILSGTPLPNSVSDLVPQFSFLFPEISVDENNVAELIKPIYVRTTKNQLNLPPIQRKIIEIEMNPNQRKFYQLLRHEEARQLEKSLSTLGRIGLRHIGRSVLRVLQLVSNPSLLAKSDLSESDLLKEVLDEGDSPKIQFVCNRARELAKDGKKVVIWSSFVENVELISRRLADLGADYIHGKVEAGSDEEEDTREAKIKRFHDDAKSFVLVANPAACAEGISLHTVCHHAIYLDRTYNAAQYLQSEDRIHRIGLKPDQLTNIEIVQCPDSIDDSVNHRLIKKITVMAKVLSDPSLEIEPVNEDLDDDGMDPDDIQDYLKHLKGEPK